MNINPTNIYGVYKKNAAMQKNAKETRAAPGGSEKTDVVSISQEAAQQKDVSKLTAEIARSVIEPTGEEKLARIREAIGNNTYYVSSDALTSAMLGRAVGEE